MSKSKKLAVNRRGFLKGAATAAAGAAAIASHVPESVDAQTQPAVGGRSNTPAPPPTTTQLERDAGAVRPPAGGNARAAVRPGSDLMVQVLRDLTRALLKSYELQLLRKAKPAGTGVRSRSAPAIISLSAGPSR